MVPTENIGMVASKKAALGGGGSRNKPRGGPFKRLSEHNKAKRGRDAAGEVKNISSETRRKVPSHNPDKTVSLYKGLPLQKTVGQQRGFASVSGEEQGKKPGGKGTNKKTNSQVI